MRLSTDADRDAQRGIDTIVAALASGITVFDTAHAYGHGAAELGHNERLLARALRESRATTARVVTKGGMSRAGDAWIPDGRAKAIRAGCEASLDALDGAPIDLYLVHAPDPRTPWLTTVRALARLLDEGLVRHVGLSNINRPQLEQALDVVDVTAVEIGLSVHDDRAIRGGLLGFCADKAIAVIAHSPLGGPRRARSLDRDRTLTDIARVHGATPQEIGLAWLLALSPTVVAIPGATRPETARSAAHAATVTLQDEESARIAHAFGVHAHPRVSERRPAVTAQEVVLIMGIPGAGKTRAAGEYVQRGYVRLNRDERGGSLRDIAGALEETLASGAPRVLLDNTYLTRASRSLAIAAAHRHGALIRCTWLDTPLAQAQINMVTRLLERFGALPSPETLRATARREEGLLTPTSQMRALRELEPPSADEGFTAVDRVAFVRSTPRGKAPGVFVAAGALRRDGWQRSLDGAHRDAARLVFDWAPDGDVDVLAHLVEALRKEAGGAVDSAVCPHPAGPPRCWCRPPLPGLPLAFAHAHAVDPARSILVGSSPAHRTLAAALGARYVAA
jgi:aryl-alcohol dehydrogenase-like predicted oxidoreductase